MSIWYPAKNFIERFLSFWGEYFVRGSTVYDRDPGKCLSLSGFFACLKCPLSDVLLPMNHRVLQLYSRPSIIGTSLIRTFDYPNYQINDTHSICGVHQIELTSPPLKS